MKYLIRGFTGPNPDFSFTVDADIMPQGVTLRDIVLDHFTHDCDWVTDLESCESYALSEDEEQSHLRDTDSQRVYLVKGVNCIEHGEDEEACEADDGNNCDSTLYMITVDVEGE